MLKEDLCHLVSLLIVLWVIIVVGDKTKYCYCPGFFFFFLILTLSTWLTATSQEVLRTSMSLVKVVSFLRE